MKKILSILILLNQLVKMKGDGGDEPPKSKVQAVGYYNRAPLTNKNVVVDAGEAAAK